MVVNKKMLQMEEKTCYGAKNNPRSQNEVHKRPMSVLSSVTHYGIQLPCLPCMALCGLVWPCVALCGLVWPCMALCGLVWPCVGSYDRVIFYGHRHVALCGLVWALFGLIWSFMAQYRLFSRS